MRGEKNENKKENLKDSCDLAELLASRFGPLALASAAGKAAAAECSGNMELSAIWRSVIDQLRTSLIQARTTSVV